MKRVTCLTIFLLVFFAAGLSFAGIPGTPDRTPALTLVVPFFEVGINVTQDPVDTLLVVTNVMASQRMIHYHVWDINGNAVDLFDDEDLNGSATWSASMRALIEGSTSAVQAALTDGDFYRGFVTIDVVTAQTVKNPTESGYPIATGATNNSLEGFIYYVRLAQGSSNSLDMIPINWVGLGVDNLLRGFYTGGDEQEEIDGSARACAETLASGGGPCGGTGDIAQVDSRVFQSSALNAKTRIILFAWDPGFLAGPSIYCDTHACDSTYTRKQFDEEGSTVVDDTIRLDNVVNIIPVTVTTNGWVSIRDIADPTNDRQVYAFSITNAKPSSGASANWDAILESFIVP
jgi:hypothetical protein